MRETTKQYQASVTRTLAYLLVCLALIAVFSGQAQAAFGVLDSTYIIFHFHGTDTLSHMGAALVPLGDINNDGFDDIAIYSQSPMGTYVFLGGNPCDALPDMFLDGWQPVPPIDLTGDGIPEMITAGGFIINGLGSGLLYFYQGYADSIGSQPYDSLFPPLDTVGGTPTNWGFGWTGYNRGFAFADSDSLGDLIASKPYAPDGPILYYYSGAPTLDTVADWSFRGGFYSYTMWYFGFIDFDGDGAQDIFVGASADLDTLSYVYIFRGPQFGPSPDVVIADPADLDTLDRELFAEGVWNIGDVNGDGWEDLGVKYNFVGLIYCCGPGADTLYDVKLQYGVDFMSSAGDVNGDGYNDLIVGSAMRSAYGTVDLYLGGPRFDGYLDDYLARSDLPPLFLDEIGYRVSSAGDFNGDGIDDFMFSCQNFAHGEPNDVFVIKGSPNIITDVAEVQDSLVPQETFLVPNYPNPFHSSTTIEFVLSKPSRVQLTVINILGQEVAHLVDRQMSVGRHYAVWWGVTDRGELVAPGVYFCRLKTADVDESRKMYIRR